MCLGQIRKFISSFKDSFILKNYSTFLYLLGSINLYFMCELLKASPYIKRETYNYDNCLSYFDNKIDTQNKFKICDILNHRESYNSFVTNLVFNIILVYSLNREFISERYFDLKYWLVSHGSAIIYSLICEFELFQFSIDNNTNYDFGKIVLLSVVGIFLFLLLLRQLYKNMINYNYIIRIILLYTFIYILIRLVTDNINFHLHHAIFVGILSLFFTNFDSNIDYYFHAILMGIFIQGINFFTVHEIFLFNITHISYPSFNFMIFLFAGFSIFYLFCILIKRLFCQQKENNEDYRLFDDIDLLKINQLDQMDSIEMQLIPK